MALSYLWCLIQTGMTKFYHHPEGFDLELGERLGSLTIAYDIFGEPNAAADNIVWVCHALTANSDVADWWPHTVEEGAFLDPTCYCTVCANIIGSHYGSTGPLTPDAITGEPLYGDFPRLTVGDWARAHSLLADALGFKKIHRLIGSSVGGFQALEWAVREPWRFDGLTLIATDAKASPWLIAVDETQRMAIKGDPTWGQRRSYAAAQGLAAARAIAMLTYRGPEGYNLSQRDPEGLGAGDIHRAMTYQHHQGEKLARRFNAYSYATILDAFDTHDIGRGRGGVRAALQTLTMPATVVGISTDICFTPAEMKALADALPNAEYHEIDSPFGHDGFLVEHKQLNDILR